MEWEDAGGIGGGDLQFTFLWRCRGIDMYNCQSTLAINQ